MSEIDLLIDEENELTFQINVEGSRPASSKCRLFIENTDMSLLFEASNVSSGEVSIVVPSLSHVLKEGKYDMILEVIVDDKYFTPLTLKGNFERSLTVTAEAVTRKKSKKETKASAKLITSSKSKIKPIKENKENQNIHEITDNEIMRIISAIVSKNKRRR